MYTSLEILKIILINTKELYMQVWKTDNYYSIIYLAFESIVKGNIILQAHYMYVVHWFYQPLILPLWWYFCIPTSLPAQIQELRSGSFKGLLR